MKAIMQMLFQGQDLATEDCRTLFEAVLGGELSDIEISAILMALKVKGETGKEIASLVTLLREKAQPIQAPDGLFADCCGTGGDGLNTFNVSTASALTAAACGLPMVKHGNRAASSPSGSADIIERTGLKLDMSAEQSSQLFDHKQFCFLFAPAYHPLVGQVMPVRRTLATATIFNLAGPLANPTSPPVQLMGVCDENLLQPMAEVLQRIGCQRGLVVYGAGLDEVAPHEQTKAVLVEPDEIKPMTIDVGEFGLTPSPLKHIQLAAEDDAKVVFDSVIEGRAEAPKIDMVAMNTGTLLWLAEQAPSLKAGADMARTALIEGRVASYVEALVNSAQEIARST